MGWLTESAFLPKESKKIMVDNTQSLVTLKAKILEEKTKLTKGLGDSSQLKAPKL